MIIVGTNETIQVQLYHEWLSNLSMYEQELDHLEHVLAGTVLKSIHLDAAIELDALKDLVHIQQKQLVDLTAEVLEKCNKPHSDSGVVAFSEVIKDNQLREKIRKAEHSVFYLKYHVNKLLSIAS